MQYGSHIRVWRGCYYHHGIYVGDGQVVHYKSEGIVMSPLYEFEDGGIIEEVHHEEQDFDLTVSRAYMRLGESSYNLIFNNCESFANWCAIGRNTSNQVRLVLSLLTGLDF